MSQSAGQHETSVAGLSWMPWSWQQRYRQWLDRRIPSSGQVTLDQKNLFIFLSWQGVAFLLLCALVWTGATNYQNNPAFGLCFLLLSLVFVAILFTFANVSGLQLSVVAAPPVFAGSDARVTLQLQAPVLHQAIELFWPQGVHVVASVLPHEPAQVELAVPALRRGWLQPGRLCLQSDYPLGIVRCWTWLDLAVRVLVYPQPLESDWQSCAAGDSDSRARPVRGDDEFHALRRYREGESLSRVAWKAYARGRGMLVRDSRDYRGVDVWLDFAMLADDVETRLGKLCYCALQLHREQRVFGLRLPGVTIAPGSGDSHLQQVLQALALY